MARYYVKFQQWEGRYFGEFGNNSDRFDVAVTAVRDKCRTVLDSLADQANWLVSDIAKWQGTAGEYGYAFYIQHNDGAGSATGPQWLIVIPGVSSFANAGAELEEIWGAGSDATIAQYVIEPGSRTLFGSDYAWTVHYNPTGGTSTPYDSGSTWAADGSLTGGDLSAPTTNPYSDLNTFMPNTTQPLGSSLPDIGDGSELALILDDAKPFLMLVTTNDRENYISQLSLSGKIIDPYLGTDTFTDGNFVADITVTGSTTNNEVHCYDPSGTRATYSWVDSSDFNLGNARLANGDYVWDIVAVFGTAGLKGYMDADLVKVIGPNYRNFMDLFEQDGNLFLKVHDRIAVPYVASVPLFPSE